MKTCFLVLSGIVLALSLSAQRPVVSPEMRNIAVKMELYPPESPVNSPFVKPVTQLKDDTEWHIGTTWYDFQSAANRIVVFPDGAVGAIWTHGMDHENGFPDRGTGYNYFDGTTWGDIPPVRVEDERTGRPSYAAWGVNGEIIGAHTDTSGIMISGRENRGTGNWDFSLHSGPLPDHRRLLWNRMVTGGPVNNRVHLLALTASDHYQGTPFMGLNGALVYSMSTDGGISWEMDNVILDGTGAGHYPGYYPDSYAFAPPKDNVIAFTVGHFWHDLYLMKSVDGGETFTKTVIWEHPYPFWTPYNPTDTFFCVDGSHSVVLDNNDVAHVAFGINRAVSDGTQASWFPFVGGIGYWNENMPPFSNHLHALDPYGHPDSELMEDYNLIGWTQDVNGDGQITFVSSGIEAIGLYYLGLSSMPQLVYTPCGCLILFFSSVTEMYYSKENQNYRHIWLRCLPKDETTWASFFVDLNTDLTHIFDECVYPSLASNVYNYLNMVYQTDNKPGLHLWGDSHPATENRSYFMSIWFNYFYYCEIIGEEENYAFQNDFDRYQNYPNPARGITTIPVNLRRDCDLCLEIFDFTGKKVMAQSIVLAKAGLNKFTVNAADLAKGIYFYKVIAGDNIVVKKMIVE